MLKHLLRWLLVTVAATLPAVPVFAQPGADAFDIRAAVSTPPRVADRTLTTTITRLDLLPTGLHIEFDKRDGPNRWPSVPWGNPGDSLQYTVWVGARLGDSWHLAASLNVWYGLDNYGGPVSIPSQYSQNLWYLDSALGQHTPVVGEPLAFLVTAGGDRGTDGHLVWERSNIVVVPMPAPNGASYTFAAVPTPTLPPVPTPAPVPAPASAPLPSTELAGVINQQAIDHAILLQLQAEQAATRRDIADFREAVRSKWVAVVDSPVFKYGLAAITGWFLKNAVKP